MAAMIVAHGAPGHRYALADSEMMLTRTTGGSMPVNPVERSNHAAYIEKMSARIISTLAKDTGRDGEAVRLAMEYERNLTAQEAREFGLIDEVVT